jgi:hypothetical protein
VARQRVRMDAARNQLAVDQHAVAVEDDEAVAARPLGMLDRAQDQDALSAVSSSGTQ